jgi:hypothetical protein
VVSCSRKIVSALCSVEFNLHVYVLSIVILCSQTFCLAALTGQGKFLLAAHRNRCGFRMEYIISTHGDLSQGSHVGKLK